MNLHNIDRLQPHVNARQIQGVRFDMKAFFSPDQFHPTACLAGFAVIEQHGLENVLRDVPQGTIGCMAMDILGLDIDQAHPLFNPMHVAELTCDEATRVAPAMLRWLRNLDRSPNPRAIVDHWQILVHEGERSHPPGADNGYASGGWYSTLQDAFREPPRLAPYRYSITARGAEGQRFVEFEDSIRARLSVVERA